jgi:hypothetical protein
MREAAMKNANPSLNPANNGTLAGTLEFCLSKILANIQNALPAKIIAYNRTTNRAQVQAMIAVVDTNNATISRAQIASVPVLQLGGGGFMLSFNLVPGNMGWIIANDRDISVFLQSYKEAQPASNRIHSFSDALFIPDVMTGYSIASEDKNNAVLQSTDGTVKVSLGVGKIKILAPIVEIDGATAINMTTPLETLNGNLLVNGNIVTTGTITPGS